MVLVLQFFIRLVELGINFGTLLFLAFKFFLKDFVFRFELAKTLVSLVDVVSGLFDLQFDLLNLLRVLLELALSFLFTLLERVNLINQLIVTQLHLG